jgi:C-terminal processing protease CtpA/Prc
LLSFSKYLALAIIILITGMVYSQNFTRKQYGEDFKTFWETLRDNYAYFDAKQTDWNKVKEIYEPQLEGIKDERGFIRLLENMLSELYDSHTQLKTNLADSYRLVPSGLDIWAEWIGGKCVITEVRRKSLADSAGIMPGMVVVSIDGIPMEQAIEPLLGKSLKSIDNKVKDWAVRVLLAGKHNAVNYVGIENRGRTIIYDFKNVDYKPDTKNLIESKFLDNNIGYIKINNSLWNTDLIADFDNAIDSVFDTDGIILDLRDTPGGGNSVVARAIMSRFIDKEMPYQKHELPAEERQYGVKRSWVEYVAPRGKIYSKPMVILADHWTGSMGEGITIGFDAMKRAVIVGTKLAGLIGAKYDFTLPNTNIGVSYAAEKLFHINGTPRENFVPEINVDLQSINKDSTDKILDEGIKVLLGKIKN